VNDLLLLVHRIPFPPNKGDKVRSYHLLKYLAQHYRVHLGTFVDAQEDWQYVDKVKELCQDSHFAQLNPSSARFRSLRGLFSGAALTLPYYFDAGLQSWVAQKLALGSIKHAVVFSSAMAQYLPREKNGMTRVADLVDVDSDKWAQYAKSKSWPKSWIYRREAERLLAFERQIAREFDSVVLVNEKEATLSQTLAPESAQRITHANNGVDTEYFSAAQSFEDPYHGDCQVLVFTGAMDYWPNVDAVEWFAEAVFPAVRAKFANARFFVVGSRPDPRVKKLAALPGVVVTGSVPDIRPYLAHAAMAVAPLRIARGTQNKVLEAMAMGKVVIASQEAAQGVSAAHGAELIVANDAAEFIEQISLGLNGNKRDSIGERARECVMQKYSWDANLSRIGRMLDPTLQAPTTSAKQGNQRDARILAFPSRKSA
jgi:sugar transferase (PEP-CTERM/EpsH1 system associated)